MTTTLRTLTASLLLILTACNADRQSDTITGDADGFISNRAAATWEEALVTGNGIMGAMVMGNPYSDTMIVNHALLYLPLNKPLKPVSQGEHLDTIRAMMMRGEYGEASRYVVELSRSEGYGAKRWTDPFIPAFQLVTDIKRETSVEDNSSYNPNDNADKEITDNNNNESDNADSDIGESTKDDSDRNATDKDTTGKAPSDNTADKYSRRVNFRTGEAVVEWSDQYGTFSKSTFVSRKDNLIITRITSPGSDMDCTISLQPRHQYSWWESIDKRTSTGISPEQLEVSGNSITWHAEFDNRWEGMIQGYSGGTMVINSGGSIESADHGITVSGATEILLLTWVDPEWTGTGTGTGGSTAGERINTITSGLKDYNGYLQEHVAIHGDLYNRVSLHLGGDRSLLSKPVEEILSEATGKPDPALIERAFNAARYNIISATGINPPNLQGIWSGTLSPPWSGDYTTNGNLPVAISALLSTGTPELMLSTFDMLERHMADFEENASELFGTRGIHVPSRLSSHGLNNHFDATWPMTFWTGGAGWYSMFYYDYFLHTCDTAFLTGRALPFMEKAVAFYEDFLVKGDDGKYIFIPSYSPENNPSNIPYQASVNATMDVMIARQLLRNIIAASESAGANSERIPRWKEMLDAMPPYEINDRGELREWMWPGVEENHAHRHVSQLYALFDIMDPEFRDNHDLINGARMVIGEKMKYRHNTNGGEMAFGLAQLGFAAAMLGDAETCYDILGWLTTRYWRNNMVTTHDPGSLFNLDLSGGYPGLLTRMLAYSEPGVISLLPAMPAGLGTGSAEGILLRGGLTINHMTWEEGRIKAEITSVRDQEFVLQLPGDITRIRVRGAAFKQGEIPSERIITAKKGKITLDISFSEDSAEEFYYRNPNTQLPFRDTHIIPHDSVFYAIGTSPPYWGGPNDGVKLYRSPDLKNWEYVDLLIDAAALDDDVWYKDRFWAPELHRFNNRFFLTFNCQNSGGGSYASENMKHFHACGVAVADNIEGPYTVVTHDKPLTSFPSNDMTLFQDEDGKIFCFFNNGWTDLHHIYVAELDTVNYELKEEPVLLISQEPGRWDGAGIEGAHVIKNKGTYYMFYSSWTQGYAVGYATAESVYGPWTKYEGNPLFGAFMRNDSTFIFREGEAVYDYASPYTTVGHNQVFTGVDGRVWISCHGYRKGDENASMIMDPIWFEDGRLKTNAPTYTTQMVRVSDDMAAGFPGLVR